MGNALIVAVFTVFDDGGNGGAWTSPRNGFAVETRYM